MRTLHRGRQSLIFDRHPSILASSAIGGKKELEGPLSAFFDVTNQDTTFGQTSWEKAECKMQELALETAKRKAGLHNRDLDALFADAKQNGMYAQYSTVDEVLNANRQHRETE